ncbi:hypothetical protein MROS_2745 [Melioribacter roseus P3M-2]|uniref:Uncharacterized protein n=1 Tax=Melioribacter roseus (strain DSM 23840 / JCM 17771 / VKM B-2668 / P3M-2) TaxID=1191523 RepID=I6ZA13_MELRP|nr:hypothetical protein [Melioribacter roseus]AFN75975.1 hypothetical protein MROS_2745 [Melioribacter roseus P3M-2]
MESITKNIWILLTLIIPGLFTYGIWRILMLLYPLAKVSSESLSRIDESALVSASIITAIALIQQSAGLVIESLLYALVFKKKEKWVNMYYVICKRFELEAAGKLYDNTKRIIGNFFLSVNMSVGLILLIIYFTAYESLSFNHWIPITLIMLIAASVTASAFRLLNAARAVSVYKSKP